MEIWPCDFLEKYPCQYLTEIQNEIKKVIFDVFVV